MIKEIQKKIGVTADGMVGPKTLAAAKKALANGTITNEEMYELSGDQYKPNPFIPGSMTTLNGDDYVPNKETGDVQENPFIAGSMTKLNGQSYIPEQFEKKENPISVGDGRNWNADVEIKDVPKVENKTGIMALLNPLDSPDYMGSKLYLKNERENYAKAIGGTPVISKVFQGIDYSNSDIKDLMDSAMDDVKTQEAMKNYQEERQKGAMDNIRAMANQYQDAAASIRQNIDVSAQQNKEIDGEIARLQSIADDKKISQPTRDDAKRQIDVLRAKKVDTTKMSKDADEKEQKGDELNSMLLMGYDFSKPIVKSTDEEEQPVQPVQTVEPEQPNPKGTPKVSNQKHSGSNKSNVGLSTPISGTSFSQYPTEKDATRAKADDINQNNNNVLGNLNTYISNIGSDPNRFEDVLTEYEKLAAQNSGVDLTQYKAGLDEKFKNLTPAQQKEIKKRHKGF